MKTYDPASPDYRPIEGEPELRAAVKAARLRLRISVQARKERRPAIEIYPRTPDGVNTFPLIVASSSASALNWLAEYQEQRSHA